VRSYFSSYASRYRGISLTVCSLHNLCLIL
jgi:hypothetical protein